MTRGKNHELYIVPCFICYSKDGNTSIVRSSSRHIVVWNFPERTSQKFFTREKSTIGISFIWNYYTLVDNFIINKYSVPSTTFSVDRYWRSAVKLPPDILTWNKELTKIEYEVRVETTTICWSLFCFLITWRITQINGVSKLDYTGNEHSSVSETSPVVTTVYSFKSEYMTR